MLSNFDFFEVNDIPNFSQLAILAIFCRYFGYFPQKVLKGLDEIVYTLRIISKYKSLLVKPGKVLPERRSTSREDSSVVQ